MFGGQCYVLRACVIHQHGGVLGAATTGTRSRVTVFRQGKWRRMSQGIQAGKREIYESEDSGKVHMDRTKKDFLVTLFLYTSLSDN